MIVVFKAALFVVVGLIAYFTTRRAITQVLAGEGNPLHNYVAWVTTGMDSMYLPASSQRSAAIITWCACGSGGVGLLATGNILAAIVAALLGAMLPVPAINEMQRRRRMKFDTQLVDTLTLMSNSLRAGLSFVQAVEMVAREMPAPTSQEFELVLKEFKVGVPIDVALDRLSARMGSPNLDLMVTSVNILREVGGRLTETFDAIASTIRERDKAETKIRTYTAQGKMQAYVIAAMPFALGFFLHLIDPGYIKPMYTTTLGWVMLVIMITLQLVGLMVIKKMVQIRI